MTKYKINTTTTFENELENIYYYIAFILKEPNIAQKIYNKISKEVFSLEYFPERCTKVKQYLNNENFNIRKLIINNYIVIYEINKNLKQVYILHIFHVSQNYLELF